MPLFKLNDLKQDNTGSDVARAKFIKVHLQKVENIKFLIGDLPSDNEIIFLWTLKSFNSFTFIPFVIKRSGTITNLVISTYSINTRIVNSLIKWYDKGEIRNIHIVISDTIKYRSPQIVDLINSAAAKRNIKLDFAWNHSKISLIQTQNNNFVVEGSGNFSENAQHEQYIFYNDKNIYDFRFKNIVGSIN